MNAIKSFGETAKAFSNNPLGIIALFIVLVYGVAALVTSFSASLQPADKTPLIWFLVLFPILVLGVFAWLVTRHSTKIYSPADFKDENNYVRMQLEAAVSLAAATTRGKKQGDSETDFKDIANTVQRVGPSNATTVTWQRRILWVDDHPENNVYERRAFEAIGMSFSLALSTNEALVTLKDNQFAAIISDMGRKEGPREGYELLKKLRGQEIATPFFIYAGSNLSKHKDQAAALGAQGSTNNPEELFRIVTRTIISGQEVR